MKLAKFAFTPLPLVAISVALFAALSSFGATCAFNGEWDTPPAAGDDIVITGGELSWTAAMPQQVASWTQSGGTVTFETTYDDTLPQLEVTGDVTLNGGTWTHKATGQTTKYRLKAVIGGNLTIAEDAKINVNAKGYDALYSINGKRATDFNNAGGTHGGYGFHYQDTLTEPLYGSVSEPTLPGSGGGSGSGSGGGAVWLSVSGAFVHNGVITADSKEKAASYYSGAGGSVYIRAASISGVGTISASAGVTTNQMPGGGGRVAIKLTGEDADFTNYDIVNLVRAISPNINNCGSPGTIYAETAADEPGKGWLIIKGCGKNTTEPFYMSPFGDDQLGEFSRITLASNVTVAVSGGTLNVAETTIDVADDGYQNIFCVKDGVLDYGEQDVEMSGAISFGGTGSLKAKSVKLLSGGSLSVSAAGGNLASPLAAVAGSTLTVAGPFGVSGDVTLTDATCAFKRPVVIDGNLTLAGTTKVTATAATATTSSPSDKVDVTVSGACAIGENASIDVTGCGYGPKYGPGSDGTANRNIGASHGGRSGSNNPANTQGKDPYGNIYDPTTFGSGGTGAQLGGGGGGLVILNIGGALTVNGGIIAKGTEVQYNPNAGGSINITAGSLSGAGTISADSGNSRSGGFGVGGGGRVAIKLTDPQADFTAFKDGKITAYGYARGSTGAGLKGGAGTVYLQKGGEADHHGTLIVDNENSNNSLDTPVGGEIGNVFGSVIIRNARLKIPAGETITVYGDWTNEGGSLDAGEGAVVRFAGAGEARITGETTFATLVCEEQGKKLVFEAGKTQTVTELLQLAGESSAKIGVASSESGASFTLNLAGAHLVNNISLKDCTATGGEMTALNSDDLGGNSNVKFVSAEPGMTLTWTGAASDLWGDGGNWDASRAPLTTDKIVIPAGIARMPKLQTDATVLELSVGEGMVLSLNGRNLTVQGDLTVNGSVVAQGAETLSVTGDVVWNGTARFAGTLILAGADASQSFASVAAELGNITVLNPNATFSGVINCGVFACGDAAAACDYAFAPGFRLKTTLLRVAGDGVAKNVKLRGATSGSAWFLSASDYDITGVTVSDSDASGGVKIYPKSSADGGRNVNWAFVDNRVRWNGSVSADFGNPDNWDGGKVPGAADDAYVNVANPMQITGDAAVTLGSLTVGKDAQVTVRAPLTISTSVVIEGSGTLLWDVPGTIGGNLTILSGGVLTHTVSNGKTDPYKVDLTVGDSVYVAESGAIHADAKGYQQGYTAVGQVTGASPGYGGGGYVFQNGPSVPAYGSVLCPTNYGGSAKWETSTLLGGGAIHLAITGTLTVDGAISSNGGSGYNYYTSTGGSIWLQASSLLGSGRITANGGSSTGSFWSGSGGRISLELSKGDVSEFDGFIQSYGGINNENLIHGSAGTIYLAGGSDETGCGTIVIDAGDGQLKGDARNLTDLPSQALCDKSETMWCKVVVRNGACLSITEDTQIKDLVLEGSSSTVRLNGHTLAVRIFQHALGTDESTQVIPGEGGTIAWDKPGFMILVR